MLTKKERAAIAERFISYDGNKLYFAELFKCLFGREIPRDATTKGSTKTVIDRLIDLCDTSNMIKLPRDKDGEVIHIGDVVYDDEGREWRANSLVFYDDAVTVEVRYDYLSMVYRSDILSHRKPAKNSVLAEQIRNVVRSAISMPTFAAKKLSRIADKLESLGDSDD